MLAHPFCVPEEQGSGWAVVTRDELVCVASLGCMGNVSPFWLKQYLL